MSATICLPCLYYNTTIDIPSESINDDGTVKVYCIGGERWLYDLRTADVVSIILLFIVPLIIITILCARIGAVIWKRSAVMRSVQDSGKSEDDGFPEVPHDSIVTVVSAPSNDTEAAEGGLERLQEIDDIETDDENFFLARLLIVLVTSFALCNFFYHLDTIFNYYLPNYPYEEGYFHEIFPLFAFTLMHTNSAINPILYAYMSRTLGQASKNYCGERKRGETWRCSVKL